MNYRNLTLTKVKKLAAKVAKKVAREGAIIGLSGNLGSGKTTFVKAFAQSLGINAVKSPTFIVSQRYPYKQAFLYHLDFYRLENEKQLVPLGLSELRTGANIVLIEWVDKFPKIARKCDILISFKVKELNKRDVTIKFN